MKSTKPFAETLAAILEIEGLSARELSKRVQRHGFKRSHSTLNRVYNGSQSPVLIDEEEQGHDPETLEAIAAALHISPDTFAEYRIWKMRRQYNPKAIGWDKTIRNLQAAERLEAARHDDDAGPVDPAELLEDEPERKSRRASRNDAAQA